MGSIEEEQKTQWPKEKGTMTKLLSSHNFARLTRWVPLLEQELPTLPGHLS
jgi:hypothetical protein